MDLDRLVVALGCPSASVCLRRSTVEDPMKRPTSAGYELSEELQKLLVRVREAIRMRRTASEPSRPTFSGSGATSSSTSSTASDGTKTHLSGKFINVVRQDN